MLRHAIDCRDAAAETLPKARSSDRLANHAGQGRRVANGESVLQPALVEKMVRLVSNRSHLAQRATGTLSEREFEVLRLAAQGLPNKEIARRMGLSIRTVHSHLASIFAKMQVGSRTEAVLLALRQGMISLQDTQGL